MEKRKKVRESGEYRSGPVSLRLSSDEDDNGIEISEITEDLESNEDKKQDLSDHKVGFIN
jgi:hypothetical protein